MSIQFSKYLVIEVGLDNENLQENLTVLRALVQAVIVLFQNGADRKGLSKDILKTYPIITTVMISVLIAESMVIMLESVLTLSVTYVVKQAIPLWTVVSRTGEKVCIVLIDLFWEIVNY